MCDFVHFLFVVGPWFHVFIEKLYYFSPQEGAGGVLKGETSIFKDFTKVVVALSVVGVVTGGDVILTFACEAARITNTAAVRRHIGF